MTNYGALAILALGRMPERQLRFLIALETITPAADGSRQIGATLLASKAGLSPSTAQRTRAELIKAGRIQYTRGNGRGNLSTYRLKFSTDPDKGSHDTDNLSGAERCSSGSVKVVNGTHKGSHRNPVTSANANGGLSTYGLGPQGGERGPYRAPPCPDCGTPFSQELLADPDFRHMAMAGEVMCAQCADRERWLDQNGYCLTCQEQASERDPDLGTCPACTSKARTAR